MVLSSECQQQVLSIAEKNSLLSEYDLQDVDFVSPGLEEQYIASEKAVCLTSKYRKSHHSWRHANLEDVLRSFQSGQLTFVGPAGSGKTTLVKMIARSVIQGKCPSLQNVELVFIIDHTIEKTVATGREVIFQSIFSGGMSEQTRKLVMEYAEKNPGRVLFILDGLDTMKLKRIGCSDNVGLDDKAIPELHLGNFLAGRYLTGCRIITSGRHYILRSFQEKVHPKWVVALTGFSKQSIEKVIFGYLDGNRAKNVMKRLENEMKPLLSLCSSPAILKYTLCVIEKHDDKINTLTDLLMIILESFEENGEGKAIGKHPRFVDQVMKNLKDLSYHGVKHDHIVFTEEYLQRYNLSEHQVTGLSLRCAWGSDFRLIRKVTHYFFTHMSVQESFAALYLACTENRQYDNFMRDEVNLPKFALVRRLLHGILRKNGSNYKVAQVKDAAYKRNLLYKNDEEILKKQINSTNPEYQEILEIFCCLYESQEINAEILQVITKIELKNLPISPSDAHIIGWVISCCSVIHGICFWNCTMNAAVFHTLEKAVEGRHIKITSLNIHENPGLEPEGMAHIGKMAGHCYMNGMTFQECNISAEHIKHLERNLDKIEHLIFFGRTNMGEACQSAILPLIPKVSSYLALDMWEISQSDEIAIQHALDELESSKLKVNVYPFKIIERTTGVKRAVSKTDDKEPPLKRAKLTTSSVKRIPRRKRRATPMIADRMCARIDEIIIKFTESHEEHGLDLSYLPLHQINFSKVASALTKKKTMKFLKLRSCLKQGVIRNLQKDLTTAITQPVIVNHVDVSANQDFGDDNAKSLGILLKNWKTKSVDLSECHFSFDEIVALQNGSHGHELQKLLYNNNTLTSKITVGLSEFSAAASVVELHIGNCNLKADQLQILEKHIPPKLQMLDLSYNRDMSSRGYASIGRAVRKSVISSVLFVDCDTVHQQLQSFQLGLKGKTLRHLDVSYNDDLVKEDYRKIISKTLELIEPATLSIAGCGVDAEMLNEIAQTSIGKKLLHLDIRDNPKLGQDPVQVVIKFIERLSLQYFDISNCGWSQSEIMTLPDNIKTVLSPRQGNH